ncbi:MAG: LLM class flavin-dependent oxidoreductase [Alphaproteobacteria bacterium]|nr:LLM class flavin-dependent oxidoreductase [Alphaproteobacteria bacterium]
MSEPLPAISLVAVPGRRNYTLDIAREMDRRGFSGIFVPSRFGNMAQCTGLALATQRTVFGTAIAPIYARSVEDFAQGAAYLHEVSAGRFRFGIGIAHGPTYQRLGVRPGKPLADIRAFVGKLRSYEGIGALPPIILAALRKKMVALAAEIAEGVVFANASLSHVPQSLAVIPAAKRSDPNFLIGNMLPVCISEDLEAAKSLLRRRLVHYALLPNYRAYWKEAGYIEEMSAVEKAAQDDRHDDIANFLTDRWLADNTVYGPASRVREGVEAWRAAGVNTPVLVPNSIAGNQMTALEELSAAFAR